MLKEFSHLGGGNMKAPGAAPTAPAPMTRPNMLQNFGQMMPAAGPAPTAPPAGNRLVQPGSSQWQNGQRFGGSVNQNILQRMQAAGMNHMQRGQQRGHHMMNRGEARLGDIKALFLRNRGNMP